MIFDSMNAYGEPAQQDGRVKGEKHRLSSLKHLGGNPTSASTSSANLHKFLRPFVHHFPYVEWAQQFLFTMRFKDSLKSPSSVVATH